MAIQKLSIAAQSKITSLSSQPRTLALAGGTNGVANTNAFTERYHRCLNANNRDYITDTCLSGKSGI